MLLIFSVFEGDDLYFVLFVNHMEALSAYPDVITENVTEDHEFVVLACDGIWDVLSNQEVVDFVRERLAENRDPQTVSVSLH